MHFRQNISYINVVDTDMVDKDMMDIKYNLHISPFPVSLIQHTDPSSPLGLVYKSFEIVRFFIPGTHWIGISERGQHYYK